MDLMDPFFLLFHHSKCAYQFAWFFLVFLVRFNVLENLWTFWIEWLKCLIIFFLYEMQPSESNTYADIEAVYQCLETEYGVSQEDLILYGQSVGSGPTLHLAAKLPRLRGVVLHSAILSGLRVLCHVKFSFCFDIYKVRSLTCFLWEMMWISLVLTSGKPMKC